MASNDTMQEMSVAQIIDKHNLIVPEIQREYVWGFNWNNILETFIEDLKTAYQTTNGSKGDASSELATLKKLLARTENEAVKHELLKEIQETELRAQGQDLNIGFLYSYKPNYSRGENKDVYLIDGQQRFTTLFLFLFYFAIKEGRKIDIQGIAERSFEEVFRFEPDIEKIAFDYRVRSNTHNFLFDLISKVNTLTDLEQLKSKNWFLDNYSRDTTIQAIVGKNEDTGTFNLLHKHFRDDTGKYFDFLLNKVRFWHFKTEETSQGEELYITMNSRGQQLADNENIRAELFNGNKAKGDLLRWSEKWEEWQDFFWKKRDHNTGESADAGFNEFLRWVVLLKMLDHKPKKSKADEFQDKLNSILRGSFKKLPVKFLSLENIDSTIASVYELQECFDDMSPLQSVYTDYHDFNLLKEQKIIGRYGEQLKQNQLFLLFPALKYLTQRRVKKLPTNQQNLFRLIRFLYNISNNRGAMKNINQQITNAINLVEQIDDSGDILSILGKEKVSTTLLSKEESLKLSNYKDSNERTKLEEQYWLAEDFSNEVVPGITHIIELTDRIAETNNLSNDSSLFRDVFYTYKEICENYKLLWGDFLITDMYRWEDYRILESWPWSKHKSFLQMVEDRFNDKDISIEEFLNKRRKAFVLNYGSSDEMKDEQNLKKQLYLYHVISKLKGKWQWENKFNFGIYESEEVDGARSLFNSGHIFERYSAQWRYNVGYQEKNGLWLQDHAKKNHDYFQELIDWANAE